MTEEWTGSILYVSAARAAVAPRPQTSRDIAAASERLETRRCMGFSFTGTGSFQTGVLQSHRPRRARGQSEFLDGLFESRAVHFPVAHPLDAEHFGLLAVAEFPADHAVRERVLDLDRARALGVVVHGHVEDVNFELPGRHDDLLHVGRS